MESLRIAPHEGDYKKNGIVNNQSKKHKINWKNVNYASLQCHKEKQMDGYDIITLICKGHYWL